MKKIIEFGITPDLSRKIADRLRITNKIALLYFFCSIAYCIVGFITDIELFYAIFIGSSFIFAGLILNYFKHITLGRFILCIYPSLICGIQAGMLTKIGSPISYSQYGLNIITCIFPFVLFTYNEKFVLSLTFVVCAGITFSINYINELIEIDGLHYEMYSRSEIHIFNTFVAILILYLCLSFLLNTENKSDQDNVELIDKISKKNQEFIKSEADLKNYIKQFKDAKIFEEQVNWQNIGITQLAEVIRQNNGKDDIFKNVINFVARYTNSLKGLLYIYSRGKKRLMYGAGYGAPKEDGVNDFLELGEGLAGQCLKEKGIIHLTEIPEDFVKIDSGLGDAVPKTVILLPVQNDNSIEGVLELAFFNDLKPHEIDFLKKVSEILSTVIFNEKNNRRNAKMMEQLQFSNNEVKAQEEELRQNLEELHATQEEMRRAQKETELKEAYLDALINNTTDSIIELDTNYKILVINNTVINRYKGTAFEGIKVGENPLDYFPEGLRQEWKAYYDRGLAGEQYKFTMPSIVAGENYVRHYNINPVKNKEGKIIGVSIFSRDIKEMENK